MPEEIDVEVAARGAARGLTVSHSAFPLDTSYKHADIHWGATLPVIEKLVETSRVVRANSARAGSAH
ncbi:MAG: hypothetical protein FJX64_09595 [Alphaproteobacteria bacterium]|nr:hypothetical protein [Alphaproteobacteria bacterium]